MNLAEAKALYAEKNSAEVALREEKVKAEIKEMEKRIEVAILEGWKSVSQPCEYPMDVHKAFLRRGFHVTVNDVSVSHSMAVSVYNVSVSGWAE